jgi:predicted acyltransferase
MKVENRLDTIDQFRGCAIILMALTHFLSRVVWIPAWLKNTKEFGFTPPDLIAAMFIFAIGLTYGLSFNRRLQRDGNWPTCVHFLRRSLALIGVGFLITPEETHWGLFQMLGVAVFITLWVIRFPIWVRLIAGAALQIGYQIVLDTAHGSISYQTIGSGFLWSLSWSAMLILATVLADLFHDPRYGRRACLGGASLALALGILVSFWIPVSLVWGTSSYILIALGGSGILFICFDWLSTRLRLRWRWLSAWGQNPLVLYVLHYYLWIEVFLRPRVPAWHQQAPLWQVGLQAVAFIGVLSGVALFLQRRQWIVSM